MSYISYRLDNRNQVGEVDGDSVVPLRGIDSITAATDTTTLAAAERDEAGRTTLAGLQLLPASPAPSKILCVGLNYRGHVQESKREIPTYPVLFTKFASNLISATADIQLPPESHQVDYEGELAIIIGKRGRRIPADRAVEHVLGYSVANDVTMRDYQYKTHQWVQGKAWDDCTPLGPTIVTPDEVDLTAARIRTVLNGETVQDSDLSKLMFDIPRLIADISEFTVLEPGDVILTGTPSGVGYRRDPQVFLSPGDVVSVEVEGVGQIENHVVGAAGTNA